MFDVLKERKSNRLEGYDYSKNGYYYVTICALNNIEWFGRVIEGNMELNEYGRIAKKIWLEIPRHFKNIKLDEFIIMPNHIHGIMIIDNATVGGRHACPLQVKRQDQTISVVIGSYKSAVARYIHQLINGHCFRWQRSFYDHVIRNEKSLIKIREYIRNNPKKWDLDAENVRREGVEPSSLAASASETDASASSATSAIIPKYILQR